MRISKWWTALPEHPQKMMELRENLEKLNWSQQESKNSLNALFYAIDQLANAELKHYFRRRRSRALISTVTRTFGWILGAFGLLMPLIAATDPSRKDLSAWGFVLIAAAISALGANSLFGGTKGHVNFVQAQLSVEALIVRNRLEWQQFLSDNSDAEIFDGRKAAAFVLIKKYAEYYSAITAAETLEWQKNTLEELDKYMSSLRRK